MSAIISPEHLHVHRLAISCQGKEIRAIRVRHLNKANEVLSECMLSPEDAWDYAQAVLHAYDEAVGLE